MTAETKSPKYSDKPFPHFKGENDELIRRLIEQRDKLDQLIKVLQAP